MVTISMALTAWGGCAVQCVLWNVIIARYENRWGMNIFQKAWGLTR